MPKPFTSNTGRRDALHKVVFTIKQELNNMVTRNVGLTCVRETSGYGRRAWRHDDVPGVQGCHDGGDDPGLLLGRLPQQISCCHHESGQDEPAQHACRARLRSSGSRANIRYQGGAATVGRIPQSFIDKIQSTRIRSEDSVHTLQVITGDTLHIRGYRFQESLRHDSQAYPEAPRVSDDSRDGEIDC